MLGSFLFYFAIVYVATLIAIVAFGYAQGRTDLLNGRNFVMMGMVNFLGVSVFNLYNPRLPHYGVYRNSDAITYAIGVTLFTAVFLAAYSYWKLPRRMGGKLLLSWPPATPGSLFVVIVTCLGCKAVAPLFISIPIVGQITFQLGLYSPIIAVVVAFCFWYQQRTNVVAIVLFLGVLAVAIFLSVAAGSGRRWIIAVLLSIPVCLYWLRLRYMPRGKVILVVGLSGVVLLMLINGYSGVRHRFRTEKRTTAAIVQMILDAGPKVFDNRAMWQVLGQDTANVSLLAIQYSRERKFEPKPMHSAWFVITNPIPRVWWKEKPKGLGWLMPHRIYKVKGSRATWGPGVVGHAFYEGGLHMLIVYALFAAFGMRMLDSMLENQPNNPYLLSYFVAISGQVIGWVRGDIGTFTMQIVAATAMIGVLVAVGRIVLGTKLRYYPESVRSAIDYYSQQQVALHRANQARQLEA